VTKEGCEILSAGVPKAPEDIEALMAQSQSKEPQSEAH